MNLDGISDKNRYAGQRGSFTLKEKFSSFNHLVPGAPIPIHGMPETVDFAARPVALAPTPQRSEPIIKEVALEGNLNAKADAESEKKQEKGRTRDRKSRRHRRRHRRRSASSEQDYSDDSDRSYSPDSDGSASETPDSEEERRQSKRKSKRSRRHRNRPSKGKKGSDIKTIQEENSIQVQAQGTTLDQSQAAIDVVAAQQAEFAEELKRLREIM